MTIAFSDVLKSYLDLPKQEINLYQNINNIHSAKVCLTVQNFRKKYPIFVFSKRGPLYFFQKMAENQKKLPKSVKNIHREYPYLFSEKFAISMKISRRPPSLYFQRGVPYLLYCYIPMWIFLCEL